jgi:hypothetical protein
MPLLLAELADDHEASCHVAARRLGRPEATMRSRCRKPKVYDLEILVASPDSEAVLVVKRPASAEPQYYVPACFDDREGRLAVVRSGAPQKSRNHVRSLRDSARLGGHSAENGRKGRQT